MKRLVFGCLVLVVALGHDLGAQTNSSVLLKYEEPKFLSGTIYSTGPDPTLPLFTFTRKATREGSSLNVVREYAYPDGNLAVRERVQYEGDMLITYELQELQTGEQGSAVIGCDRKKPSQKLIFFKWAKHEKSRSKPQTGEEPLRKDVLISDMVAPFLLSHWQQLASGEEVKCRYIVLPRRETVGFTFSKQRESTSPGKPVIIVKMEATSPILAELVDPLFFTIEKEGTHRVLEYSGRTTPKIKVGKKWKDLDAVTVFDWKSAR